MDLDLARKVSVTEGGAPARSLPKSWPRGRPAELRVPETTLWDNLQVCVTRWPDKPAYVTYGRVNTYAALSREAQRIAGWLRSECRVAPDDRVLLTGQSSPHFAAALYAIVLVGAIAVPVNPMSRHADYQFILSDTGARVAVCGADAWAQVEPSMGAGLDRALVFDYCEDGAQPDGTAPDWFFTSPGALPGGASRWRDVGMPANPDLAKPAARRPEDACLIVYTSGTSAHPKGCTHSHRSVMAGAITPAIWRGDTCEEVVLGASPMFHMQGIQTTINAPHFLGATVVLLPRWNAPLAVELIVRHGVTRWGCSPAMLLDVLALPGLQPSAFASLGFISGGGAALPIYAQRWLSEEAGISYLEGWGMTETAGMAMSNPQGHEKPGSIGIPTIGVRAKIVDPATLEPMEGATRAAGELWISARQLAQGYWGNPQADAEAFITDDEGRRWLRTGDLVTRDEDGCYFIVDRLKRMINAGGYKVWPAEVETVLYRHPAVHEVCVVAIEDDKRGEAVCAVVVPWAASGFEEHEFLAWTRGELASYKCPRRVVIRDSLPRSAAGKIDWRRIQDEIAPRDRLPAKPVP